MEAKGQAIENEIGGQNATGDTADAEGMHFLDWEWEQEEIIEEEHEAEDEEATEAILPADVIEDVPRRLRARGPAPLPAERGAEMVLPFNSHVCLGAYYAFVGGEYILAASFIVAPCLAIVRGPAYQHLPVQVRTRVCLCNTNTHVSRLQPHVFGAACTAAKEHGCVPYCARKGCAVHSKRELGRRRLIFGQRLHRAPTLHLSFADPACPMV